ncbi:MAG TPA: hypothetical protein VK400_13210 [Pyrinomonadaceae bacterium]|nr:hypothetical protein [Pyrinomonadaceae bacterium]
MIISLTQTRRLKDKAGEEFKFRGGCTLVLNLEDLRLRYVIPKPINDERRLKRHQAFHEMPFGQSLRATYFGAPNSSGNVGEPFALLHRS